MVPSEVVPKEKPAFIRLESHFQRNSVAALTEVLRQLNWQNPLDTDSNFLLAGVRRSFGGGGGRGPHSGKCKGDAHLCILSVPRKKKTRGSLFIPPLHQQAMEPAQEPLPQEGSKECVLSGQELSFLIPQSPIFACCQNGKTDGCKKGTCRGFSGSKAPHALQRMSAGGTPKSCLARPREAASPARVLVFIPLNRSTKLCFSKLPAVLRSHFPPGISMNTFPFAQERTTAAFLNTQSWLSRSLERGHS